MLFVSFAIALLAADSFLQILTKDSVTVNVDAIMYYKVSNAICAISNVDDYSQSTRLLAATTLRQVFA
jgi:erythrocyte band 7 integral membrane protein